MNDLYPTALVPEIRPEFGYGSNLRVWLRNCFHVLETGTVANGALQRGVGALSSFPPTRACAKSISMASNSMNRRARVASGCW
jgi:hypothetical protein